MKKIRIGKDIRISWRVSVDGVSRDLAGLALTLELHDERRSTVRPLDFTTEGDRLFCTVRGRNHEGLGTHSLTLWLNRGKDGQSVLDASDAFCLVARTEMEGGADDDNLATETVELSGNLSTDLSGEIAELEERVTACEDELEERDPDATPCYDFTHWIEDGFDDEDDWETFVEVHDKLIDNKATAQYNGAPMVGRGRGVSPESRHITFYDFDNGEIDRYLWEDEPPHTRHFRDWMIVTGESYDFLNQIIQGKTRQALAGSYPFYLLGSFNGWPEANAALDAAMHTDNRDNPASRVSGRLRFSVGDINCEVFQFCRDKSASLFTQVCIGALSVNEGGLTAGEDFRIYARKGYLNEGESALTMWKEYPDMDGYATRTDLQNMQADFNAHLDNCGSFASQAAMNAAFAANAKEGAMVMFGAVLNGQGLPAYGSVCFSVPFATGQYGGFFQGCLTSAGGRQGFFTRTVVKNQDGTRTNPGWS